MLKLAVLAVTLSATLSYADHLETVCQNSLMEDPSRPQYIIANPPSFSGGLLSRRVGDEQGWDYVVEDLSGKLIGSFHAPIYQIIRSEEAIWALGPFDLMEMDMSGKVINSYNFESSNISWRGRAMAINGDMLVISRGAAGLVGFDLNSRTFKWHNFMNGNDEGYPSGLASDGKVIYAAVATSREHGFTGIITIDPQTGKILRRTPYDVRRAGVVDTDAIARIYQGNLLLNNGGWIHLITPKQLQSEKAFRPRWVAHVVPQDGDVNQHYMTLNGDFFFEDNTLVGCGSYTTIVDSRFARRSKLFKVKLP